MSYDLRVGVKVADTDIITQIRTPYEYAHPTYNLREMFVKACQWDYEQGKWYKAEEVMPKIVAGIQYLRHIQFAADGGKSYALESLKAWRECIEECTYEVPIEHLWVAW